VSGRPGWCGDPEYPKQAQQNRQYQHAENQQENKQEEERRYK